MPSVPPPASLTDQLCTRCGLCCDGSLFADVELGKRDDLDGLELLGLEIEEADGPHQAGLMLLPCRALSGTRCSVYAHRPQTCRSFECLLLQQARAGTVDIPQAHAVIEQTLAAASRIRALLAILGQADGQMSLKERCVEALSAEPGPGDRDVRARVELEGALDRLELVLLQRFLPHEP